jgi:hypothetical protein
MFQPCIALMVLVSSAREDELPALLAKAKEALGRLLAPETHVESLGRAEVHGARGTFRVLLAGDGRFRSEVHSALPEGSGFDGATVWTRDPAGLECIVELGEADRLRLFHAVLSGHWLDGREFTLAAAEDESHPGHELRLGLEGSPLEMRLTLDAASHLPCELLEAGEAGARTWTFADYTAVDDIRFPRRWELQEQGDRGLFEVEVYHGVPEVERAFSVTLAPPRDVHFDPEVESELEVTRLPSGHLLVQPLIEGEDLGPFIFDTGAGITVIDKAVADELLFETLGSTVAIGVVGSTTTAFRRGERFQLGPVVLENPIYGDLDLGFLRTAAGRKVAGIVGYDLLARCVVVLEPATPRIELHDPATFRLEGGTWQPLVLHDDTPCARARYEGEHVGLFRLDSGASGTVTFHVPTVDARRLLEGRAVSASLSGGVGGTAAALEGELAWFELAGHRFEKPRVSFSRATSGAFLDRYTDGNIGASFLGAFRLVLDYGQRRIAFLPRGGKR